MDHRYELVFADPGESLSVHVASRRQGALHFDATLRMERRELRSGLLGRLLLTRMPIPAKVLGGIHVEAARTWLSGARYHPHPRKNSCRDLPNRSKNEILPVCGDDSFSR
jgi:DUF1365 family protein